MVRVHKVLKARKDNPAVKKGEPYFWWKFMHAPKQYSAKFPSRSRLTQSDKLARIYDAEDSIEAAEKAYNEAYVERGSYFSKDVGELVGALKQARDELAEVGEEYQENVSYMPDSLQESETAMYMEETADACESSASSMDEVISALEEIDSKAEEFSTGEYGNPAEALYDWVTGQLQEVEWPGV